MSTEEASHLGGLGHTSPENFEILMLWNAISSFLRGQILTKMFSKSIVIFMLIFICVTSRRVPEFILYFLWFLKVFWMSISVKYWLCHVWCHSWYHKELIWKFKNRCQNRDRFFLSRALIDRDSGFSSKIGRIPTSSSYLRLANVPECLYCRWKVKCSSFNLKNGSIHKNRKWLSWDRENYIFAQKWLRWGL